MNTIILVLIFNVFCSIEFTSQTPPKGTNNTLVFNPYRKNIVHTLITDEHIAKILDKLGSSRIAFTTESSLSTIQISPIPPFETQTLPTLHDLVAPDGSLVRLLLSTVGGSMAQFELLPGMTSNAVEHRTVYEIWYFLEGEGEFWRKQNEKEEIVKVHAEICIIIPVGTKFQFRTVGRQSLIAVAITMPPWPGENEAITIEGIWNASLTASGNSSTKLFHSFSLSMFIVLFFIMKLF